MLGEDLGGKADGLVRLNAAVGPHLQGQLVIVGDLAHAGIGHRVVDLADGGEDGVDRNDPDGHVGILVLFRAHVSAALVDGQRHLQVGILVEGGDMHLRIDELKLVINGDVLGLDLGGALHIEHDGFGLIGIQLGRQGLEVQDELAHVLGDAGHGGKLMLNALDLDAGHGHAGQRAKQHTAQGVAQRVAKAALQGLHDEFAVGAIRAELRTVDARLFDFDHSFYPPVLSHWVEGVTPHPNESRTRRSCFPAGSNRRHRAAAGRRRWR